MLPQVASNANYIKTIIQPLRKIMQLLDTHSRKLLKQHDLTIPQIMCLYEVFDKNELTIANLADSIHVSPSTLIGIVDRLENKKLVKRIPSKIDRRSVFVCITEKGKNFVLKTPHLLHNRLHHALEKLAPEKQIAIAETLACVVGMLETE